MTGTTTTTKFIEKPDCILDTNTNLEWAKENLGPMSWYQASQLSDKINNEGWRLPSIDELETLVDRTIYSPATKLPGMISSNYWSSSPYANHSNHAWIVHFYYGYVVNGYKNNGYYVRLVRV